MNATQLGLLIGLTLDRGLDDEIDVSQCIGRGR